MTNSCTFSAKQEVREHIFAYTTVTVLAVTLLVVGILARFHLGSLKNVSQLTSNYIMTAGAALIIAEIFVLFIKSFNEQSDKSVIDDKSAPQGAGSAEVTNKDPKNNDVILESELSDYAPFQPLESYFVYHTNEGFFCCYRESMDKWSINLTEGEISKKAAHKKNLGPQGIIKLNKADLESYKKRPSQQAEIDQKKLKFEQSIASSRRESPVEEIPLQPAPLSPSGQGDNNEQSSLKVPPNTPMAKAGMSTEGSEAVPAPAGVLEPILASIVEGPGDLALQPTPPEAERSTSLSLSPPSSPGSRASTAAAAPVTTTTPGLFPVT